MGPKTEDSDSIVAQFHAKERIRLVGSPPRPESVWEYEERESRLTPTSMLLIRVMIGKVKDRNRLESLLRNIPVRPEVVGRNRAAWVKEALELALRDKSVLRNPKNFNWDGIRDTVMWYAKRKRAEHRLDETKVPTWDMIDGVERVS